MRLSGGGRAIDVPGANQKIEVSLPLERKDLSGQTSGSSFSSAGAKAQKISVSTQIAMTDANKLRDLTEIARACDSTGEPIAYDIEDDLCSAHNIRQVIFAGDFKSSEADGVRAWQVSFQLQEYQSVAEKQEERAQANAAEKDGAKDGETAIGTTDPEKVNKIVRESARE